MTALFLAVWLAAQPAPDVPLPKLKAELHTAAREQVELLVKAVEKNTGSYTEAAAAVRRLADIEAETDPAAAVKVAERWVGVMKERLKLVEEWLKRGSGSRSELMDVFITLIGAEIELVRRQEAVPGGPRPDPAHKLDLYEKRVMFHTEVEKLVEQQLQFGGGNREHLLTARVARLEAAIELTKLKAAMKAGGK